MYTSLVERRLARPRGPRSAFQNILGYLLDRLGGILLAVERRGL